MIVSFLLPDHTPLLFQGTIPCSSMYTPTILWLFNEQFQWQWLHPLFVNTPLLFSPCLFHSVASTCKCPFFFIWLCKIAKTPCTAFTPALCAYRCSESKLCSAGMQPLWSFHHVCHVVFIFRQILLSPDVLMNAEGMTNVEFLIQYLLFVWHDWMSLLLLLLLLSYKLFSAHQHIFLYPAELAL